MVFKIQSIELLSEVLEERTKEMKLSLHLKHLNSALMDNLFDVLERNKGNKKLVIEVFDEDEQIQMDFFLQTAAGFGPLRSPGPPGGMSVAEWLLAGAAVFTGGIALLTAPVAAAAGGCGARPARRRCGRAGALDRGDGDRATRGAGLRAVSAQWQPGAGAEIRL